VRECRDNLVRKNLCSGKRQRATAENERNQFLDQLVLQLSNRQVIFITGLRRIGKTTLMRMLIRYLTAKRYLSYFAKTYLIYLVARHGKTNERILSPKKVYASDLGIRNLFTGFRNIGALFENYVFLKIRHLKPGYLYENKTEIDFLMINQEETAKNLKDPFSHPH